MFIGLMISVVSAYATTLANSKDVTYDNSNSTLKSTNVQGALDELYEKSKLNAVDYIFKLYNSEKKTLVTTAGEEKITQLASIGLMQDSFGNIRYYGSDPNNYITFNYEAAGWRIIGVFDTEDENGNVEKRIKLIRSTSIGNYSYDNKDTSTGADYDAGKNNWTTARIMKLLNPIEVYTPDSNDNGNGQSLYWNSQSGTCFFGQNNATTLCDFTKTGLTNKAKNQIDKVKYYLGGSSIQTDLYANNYYTFEREKIVYTGYSTSWIGYIGLMYASDYAYATDLSICTKDGLYYNNDETNCVDKDWMLDATDNSATWTMSPSSDVEERVFAIGSKSAIFFYTSAYLKYKVRPVLYLKPNIQIAKGTGTKNDPYILS